VNDFAGTLFTQCLHHDQIYTLKQKFTLKTDGQDWFQTNQHWVHRGTSLR